MKQIRIYSCGVYMDKHKMQHKKSLCLCCFVRLITQLHLLLMTSVLNQNITLAGHFLEITSPLWFCEGGTYSLTQSVLGEGGLYSLQTVFMSPTSLSGFFELEFEDDLLHKSSNAYVAMCILQIKITLSLNIKIHSTFMYISH